MEYKGQMVMENEKKNAKNECLFVSWPDYPHDVAKKSFFHIKDGQK